MGTMAEKRYKEKHEYPLTLSPAHVIEILDIGREKGYEFLNSVEMKIKKGKEHPFHINRVGKLMKIDRDGFFKWLEGSERARA